MNMTIIAVPRLVTAAIMAIAITGQLLAGALMYQYCAFNMRQIPLTPVRGIGILLFGLGAVLVIRE